MKTYLLIMSIMSSEGHYNDVLLSYDLSLADCAEMIYTLEKGLNDNATMYCEPDLGEW